MIAYQYQHGDRPLEGYTIQSAAGRGGFGEVYYAISDSGREVALKTLTAYEQIELRGISQCMNLKSPHLVSIFDVKYNAQGRPFVLMEYVSGPSLRQLLDENPSGLGEQKSAFFLREIGKGLSFLHDCGIVHRDLKPGNIFYENGYVKIGDYGLSKAISTSQHSGQTITVGTVHYMAPEVGAGKYDRSIDIYALGAVLYEMITGTPPFIGASASEILLKHLSAHPDCKGIAEPFGTVICKAMAKDPAERYQTVQEMVEAVFGAEHVRQSMSVFSPEELSVVAGRVAQRAKVSTAVPPKLPSAQSADPWARMSERFGEAGERIADHAERVGNRVADRMSGKWRPGNRTRNSAPDPSRDFSVPLNDPVSGGGRKGLAIVAIVLTAIAVAVLSPNSIGFPPLTATFVAAAIAGAVIALSIARVRLALQLQHETRGVRRLAMGGIATLGMGIGAGLVSGLNNHLPSGTWIAMIAPMFLCDIDKWIDPNRPERVRLGHAFSMGLTAFIFSMIFHGSPHVAIAVAAGTVLALQVSSPWNPRKSFQPAAQTASPAAAKIYGNINVDEITAKAMQAAGVQVYGNLNVRSEESAAAQTQTTAEYWRLRVPKAIQYLWLGGLVLTLSLAIGFLVAAGADHDLDDRTTFACLFAGFFVIGLMCAGRVGTSWYYGIWNYLLRPLLISACAIVLIVLCIEAGTQSLQGQELGVAAGFAAFSAIAIIVASFIPGKHRNAEFVPATSPQKIGATVRNHNFAGIGAHANGLLSALAGLLLFVGTIVGTAVALDLPTAANVGVFGPQVTSNLQQNVFNGYPQWPTLVSKVGFVTAGIAFLAGLVVMLFARSAGGVMYQTRAASGVALLVGFITTIHSAFSSTAAWAEIAPLTAQRQFPAAVDSFLNHWIHPNLFVAGLLLLGAIVMLALPPSAAKKA